MNQDDSRVDTLDIKMKACEDSPVLPNVGV